MWNGSATVPYYPNTSATNNSTTNYFKSNDYQAPRFDYDPTTLTARGLLIEGSATNLIYWSESFDTTGAAINWNWSAVNVTRGTVTTTAPSGASTTVVKIQETTATGLHAPLIVYGSLTSSVYTVSLFAKAVERQYLSLFDNGGSSANAMFNLSGNGAVVSQSTEGIATITPYPNGWYRITMRTPTLTNINLQFRLSTDGTTTSYEGALNSGVYIWGAQLEAGSGASSYIPTGASQATRAEDSCVMNDITWLQYSNTNGSMYYEGRFSKLNTASFPWRMGFTTETGDYRVFGFLTNSGGSSIEAKGSSSTPTASVSVSIAVNTNYKLAWSMDTTLATGELRRSSNGGAVSVSSATALTVTGTPTYFMFGQKGYGAFFPAGTIKVAKYWPTTLSDAQLQAITT
jgi:hypothetical protein